MSCRTRIILVCTLFNMLFEYSGRGINGFVRRPLLVLALFGLYLTYFAALEDLIVRFRLRDTHILLIAYLYGFIPEAFLTGNLFNTQIYWGTFAVAGVNLASVVIINFLAWGIMQSIVALYLANRIAPRDWAHPRMGALGWTLVILYQIVVVLLGQLNPVPPRGTASSFAFALLLVLGGVFLLAGSLKSHRPETHLFVRTRTMDILAFASVCLFLILGTFVTSGGTIVTSQPLNRVALAIEHVWLLLAGIAFLIFRLRRASGVSI